MNKRIENLVTSYFKGLPTIEAVFVYGSFAANQERKSSDLDIAILMDKIEYSYMDKSRISLELEELTSRSIDLVFLNETSCILQMQVLKKGKLIFCRNRPLLNRFQVGAVREYIDLKRIRKPIEDQLKNVSIYG